MLLKYDFVVSAIFLTARNLAEWVISREGPERRLCWAPTNRKSKHLEGNSNIGYETAQEKQ